MKKLKLSKRKKISQHYIYSRRMGSCLTNKESLCQNVIKKIKERQLLATKQREEFINNVLKFSRKRFKRFDEVILRLYQAEDLSPFFTDRRIAKVNECFQFFSSKTWTVERAAMKNIFIHLHRHSQLFSDEEYIQTVFNMFSSKLIGEKMFLNGNLAQSGERNR